MKIILPDGTKRYLKSKLTIEEKRIIVDEILDEFTPYFTENWDTNKTRICLDVLCSYLVTGNGVANNDKEVLSKYKEKQMQNGRKCVPFSSLSKHQKIMLGLVDIEDSDE